MFTGSRSPRGRSRAPVSGVLSLGGDGLDGTTTSARSRTWCIGTAARGSPSPCRPAAPRSSTGDTSSSKHRPWPIVSGASLSRLAHSSGSLSTPNIALQPISVYRPSGVFSGIKSPRSWELIRVRQFTRMRSATNIPSFSQRRCTREGAEEERVGRSCSSIHSETGACSSQCRYARSVLV